MQLTVDINTKKMTDATGMVALAAVDKPQLFYGTRETLEFTFLNDGEPVEFTETDTFSVALDSNFIHTDSLMASASDAVVIDGSSGRVNLTLDMRSESFNEKLNGKESVGAYLEVTVLHSGSAVPEMLLQDSITARGRVQTVEGAPESADPEYYTSVQIQSLLNAGYEMEFSADGESWHAEQSGGDLYYHYRNRQIGGEWSDEIMIPKGDKGNDAPELKSQYSADGSTLWHDEYAAGDAYMRTSSDNGESWSAALRILGPQGAAGTSSYTYVAYASDADGTGFSLVPSETLPYRAEIHSETEIESPDADDFTGAAWVRYLGSDGADGISAGFGTPTASAETLAAGSEATASVAASGGDNVKVFAFSFGIPKGADGQDGTDGTDGADGKSAYQLWLEQDGNAGKSLDDFFNAYRGSDGTGLTVRGAYDPASTYQKTDTAMDAVQYNGSLWGYINAAAGSGNAPPESTATVSNNYWTLLVAKGETGADGRGIVSIVKTGSSGKVDTYTVTYTDETTSTFTVTNGTDGQDGSDGLTPSIDPDTKHWMIGTTDTGIKAEGTDGADGKTILNGTGVPSNELGTDGDFYLDADALNLYLKVSGAWTLKSSLAAALQFAVAQADGDESTKTVSIRTVTVSADGSSVYSGSAQTVLYDFNIPAEEA